jgi:hypothetical protein
MRPIEKEIQKMKSKTIQLILLCCITGLTLSGCSKKYGCPSNGKNVGAERFMGDEKIPRAKKFKS